MSEEFDLAKELLAIQRERNKLDDREKSLLSGQKKEAIDRVLEIMAAAGIDIADLKSALKGASDLGVRQKGAKAKKEGAKPTKKVAPKFRHPDDPGIVWSGRGKTPVWLRELENQGRAKQARVRATE
jgi:DNA-binding protein H-NS